MAYEKIHSPDEMNRRANELEEAGFALAAEMLRQGADVIERVQEELHDKRQYLDDGWADNATSGKTNKQVIEDEIELLCQVLPEVDGQRPAVRPGELRHCRRCGRTDALKVEIHDGCYTVCCGHCTNRHRGGYASTEARAIELWNNGVDWTQQ